MTNVRTNSRDAKVELDRYLEDVEDGRAIPGNSRNEQDELNAARRELAKLHEEVADLRARLTTIRSQTDGARPRPTTGKYPWLGIAPMVMATFALGKLVQQLRLGTPRAAVVSMIARHIDRRF